MHIHISKTIQKSISIVVVICFLFSNTLYAADYGHLRVPLKFNQKALLEKQLSDIDQLLQKAESEQDLAKLSKLLRNVEKSVKENKIKDLNVHIADIDKKLKVAAWLFRGKVVSIIDDHTGRKGMNLSMADILKILPSKDWAKKVKGGYEIHVDTRIMGGEFLERPQVQVLADAEKVNAINQKLANIGVIEKGGSITDLMADIVPIAIDAGVDVAKLSLFACKEALSVVSQDDDSAPQLFLLVPPADKESSFISGFMAYMETVGRERDEFRLTEEEKFQFTIKETTLKNRKAYLVRLDTSRLADKRAVLRWVMDNTQVEKEKIGTGLELVEEYQAVSPITKRQIINADQERVFLDNIREGARKAKERYPKLWKFVQYIMDPNSGDTELRFTKEEIVEWGIKESAEDYMDEKAIYKLKKDLFAKMVQNAPKATAGYRETIDFLLSIDLSKPMNLLIIVFLLNELSEMAVAQAEKQGDIPEAIVAGESRCHTEVILEALRRMMAAKGMVVHSPKRGYKVPIGVLSFAAIKNRVMIAAYITASHAKRFITTSKIMGFVAPQLTPFIEKAMRYFAGKIATDEFKKAKTEGAQLLIPQMLELMAGIQKKLNHTLTTGEDFVIKFAGGKDTRIKFDINNPDHPENINVTEQYAQYFEGFWFRDQAIKDAVTKALTRKEIDISYFQSNGASYQFNYEMVERLFGKEAAKSIKWYAVHPDTYLGGTGVSYYNPFKDKDLRIKDMVEKNKKELDKFFSDKKINFSIIADSDILDEGGKPKKIVFEVLEKEALTQIINRQEMTYIELSNGNYLAYYEKSYYDATQDVSLLEVVMRSYIPAYMMDEKIGHIQMVTDPDGDRHVVLQVEKNDEETKKRLERLNIAYKVIDDNKLVAVYVPNQSFLMIKEHAIQTLKDLEAWNQDVNDPDAIIFFEASTTVSSITWTDSCTKNHIPIIHLPVGYKEIARIFRVIEIPIIRNNLLKLLGRSPKRIIVHNIFEDPIDLGYKPRLLFAGEESGGMSLGSLILLSAKYAVKGLIARIKGEKSQVATREFLGWREKSAVEPGLLFLLMCSTMAGRGEKIVLSKLLEDIYKRNNSVNTAEERWDEVLTDDAALAMTDNPVEVKRIKDEAEKRRDYNDAFFCGLAFALQDGKIDLNQAKEIIKSGIANDHKVLERLAKIREEDLVKWKVPESERKERILQDLYSYIDKITAIRFQGDGTHITFEDGWRLTIRPSGTEAKNKGCPGTDDPYKSALLAVGGSALNPTIKEVRAKYEEVLGELDTEALVGNEGRKLKQYERGLAVDQPVSWTYRARVQKLLRKKFGKVKWFIPYSDVFIFLAPRSQKEPLVYVKQTGVLYVSWGFDDNMNEAENDKKKQADLFRKALEKVKEFETASEYIQWKNPVKFNRLKQMQQMAGAETGTDGTEKAQIRNILGEKSALDPAIVKAVKEFNLDKDVEKLRRQLTDAGLTTSEINILLVGLTSGERDEDIIKRYQEIDRIVDELDKFADNGGDERLVEKHRAELSKIPKEYREPSFSSNIIRNNMLKRLKDIYESVKKLMERSDIYNLMDRSRAKNEKLSSLNAMQRLNQRIVADLKSVFARKDEIFGELDKAIGGDSIDEVIILGMGGSGIAPSVANGITEVVRNKLRIIEDVKVTIIKGDEIPRDEIGKNTLVIALTWSGTTGETLSALRDAIDKGATHLLAAATNGEEIKKIKSDIPFISMPGDEKTQPREGYSFALPINILIRAYFHKKNNHPEFLESLGLDEAVKEIEDYLKANPSKEPISEELLMRGLDKGKGFVFIYEKDNPVLKNIALRAFQQHSECYKYPCEFMEDSNDLDVRALNGNFIPVIFKYWDAKQTYAEGKLKDLNPIVIAAQSNNVFADAIKREIQYTRAMYRLAAYNGIDPMPAFVIRKFKAIMKEIVASAGGLSKVKGNEYKDKLVGEGYDLRAKPHNYNEISEYVGETTPIIVASEEASKDAYDLAEKLWQEKHIKPLVRISPEWLHNAINGIVPFALGRNFSIVVLETGQEKGFSKVQDDVVKVEFLKPFKPMVCLATGEAIDRIKYLEKSIERNALVPSPDEFSPEALNNPELAPSIALWTDIYENVFRGKRWHEGLPQPLASAYFEFLRSLAEGFDLERFNKEEKTDAAIDTFNLKEEDTDIIRKISKLIAAGNAFDTGQVWDVRGDDFKVLKHNLELIVEKIKNAKCINIFPDNAGMELLGVLLLSYLAPTDSTINLVCKPYHCFGSDATEYDVRYTLKKMKESGNGFLVGAAKELELREAAGKFVIKPQPFFAALVDIALIPEEIERELHMNDDTTVNIFDGDAYWRAVGGNFCVGHEASLEDLIAKNRKNIAVIRASKSEEVPVNSSEGLLLGIYRMAVNDEVTGVKIKWWQKGSTATVFLVEKGTRPVGHFNKYLTYDPLEAQRLELNISADKIQLREIIENMLLKENITGQIRDIGNFNTLEDIIKKQKRRNSTIEINIRLRGEEKDRIVKLYYFQSPYGYYTILKLSDSSMHYLASPFSQYKESIRLDGTRIEIPQEVYNAHYTTGFKDKKSFSSEIELIDRTIVLKRVIQQLTGIREMTSIKMMEQLASVMNVAGLTEFGRQVGNLKTSLDCVALVENLAAKSKKSKEEVMEILMKIPWFKSRALKAKLEEAKKKGLDPKESTCRYLRIDVGRDGSSISKDSDPQKLAPIGPLSDFMVAQFESAKDTVTPHRDNMDEHVGRFLGFLDAKSNFYKETIVNGQKLSDLKEEIDRLEVFLRGEIEKGKPTELARIVNFVNNGIGANEMYIRQLAYYLNSAAECLALPFRWIVVNSPAGIYYIKEQGTDPATENILEYDESRSGGTAEPAGHMAITCNPEGPLYINKRIVWANGSTFHKTGEDLAGQDNKSSVMLIDNIYDKIGGRHMNLKTGMVTGPLFTAFSILGYRLFNDYDKAFEFARENLKSYVSGLYEATMALSPKQEGFESAVNNPSSHLSMETLRKRDVDGRVKIPMVYDPSLKGFAMEFFQTGNEGFCKPAKGKERNNNMLSPWDASNERLDYVGAGLANSKLYQYIFLVNLGSEYARDMLSNARTLSEEGIPVKVVTLDIKNIEEEDTKQVVLEKLKHNLAVQAQASALLQTAVTTYTHITDQDPNSNPAVKFTRLITKAIEDILTERRADMGRDLNDSEKWISMSEIWQTITTMEEKGLEDARKKLAGKIGQVKEQAEPTLPVVFKDFVDQALMPAVKGLGLDEEEFISTFIGCLSRKRFFADMAEAGAIGEAIVVAAAEAFDINSGIGKLTEDFKLEPLNNQIIAYKNADKGYVFSFACPPDVSNEQKRSYENKAIQELPQTIADYYWDRVQEANKMDTLNTMAVSFADNDEGNADIVGIMAKVNQLLEEFGITSLPIGFPNSAHKGIEAAQALAEIIAVIGLIPQKSFPEGMSQIGSIEIRKGLTINDGMKAYPLSNIVRMAFGGSPTVMLEYRDKEQLGEIKDIMVKALEILAKRLKAASSSELDVLITNQPARQTEL